MSKKDRAKTGKTPRTHKTDNTPKTDNTARTDNLVLLTILSVTVSCLCGMLSAIMITVSIIIIGTLQSKIDLLVGGMVLLSGTLLLPTTLKIEYDYITERYDINAKKLMIINGALELCMAAFMSGLLMTL